MSASAKEKSWSDYVALLRRRWRPTVAAAMLVFLSVLFIAFSLPPVYQSSALVLIEQQGIPSDFVQTTVNSYLDERLQAIHRRVIAAPNALELIAKHELYPEERTILAEQELIALFQDNARLEPQYINTVHPVTGREVTVNYAFRISYFYDEPVKARDVAQDLAGRYVEQNEALRGEGAERATQFFDLEAERFEVELADVSRRIAQFKEQHPNNLPEDQATNQRMWEARRNELTTVEQALRAARQERARLEAQLDETPRYRPVLDDSGEVVLGGTDRLAEAQQELMRLRGRYSENHPAIINLRREIDALSTLPTNQATLAQQLRSDLSARRLELAAARDVYSESHPDVVQLRSTVQSLEEQLAEIESGVAAGSATSVLPNNPAYVQLSTSLDITDEEIQDLTRRRDDLSARIGELEALSRSAPQIERDYTALTNEQSLLRSQYNELRSLESQASLAQSLETGESGERLTLLEPARVPSGPVSPNRLSLSFLGFVLALAAGLGIASLTDAADTTVRGQRDVYDLLEMPPMGVIPYVEGAWDTARRLTLNIGMAAVAAGATIYLVMTAL